MNKRTIVLAALGAGAGLMYLADPREGRRRRGRVRDAVTHTSHVVADAASAASRDLRNRVGGLAARTVTAVARRPAPIDDVIVARVRSHLGRLVSHPGAIAVSAKSGVVSLQGPVFEAELRQLLRGVLAVPGVIALENHLDAHHRARDVPALQGPGPMHAAAHRIRWTPTARLLAGIAGATLMAVSARGGVPRAAAAGVAGLELLERAFFGTGPEAAAR